MKSRQSRCRSVWAFNDTHIIFKESWIFQNICHTLLIHDINADWTYEFNLHMIHMIFNIYVFFCIPRWLLLYHQTHRSKTPLDRKPCCIELWSRCGPWRWLWEFWWKMMVHEDMFIEFICLDISHIDEYYSHRFTSQLLNFCFFFTWLWLTCYLWGCGLWVDSAGERISEEFGISAHQAQQAKACRMIGMVNAGIAPGIFCKIGRWLTMLTWKPIIPSIYTDAESRRQIPGWFTVGIPTWRSLRSNCQMPWL